MANQYGTRQNNEYNSENNRKSITTKIYQFKNKEGFEPSTLQISGWDEMMSFRINPALEPNKQSREQIFDYDRFVATSLNMEKAMLLLYKINTDIIPAMENDEEKNVGISIGGDSLITVGTGKKITGSIRPYVAIHKSLNPETKKPEQSIYYEFKTAMTIDDYDEKTGTYKISEGTNAEFKLFVNLLESFVKDSSFTGHTVRTNCRFTHERLINNTTAIATKVGADTGFKGSASNFNSRKNVFSSSYSNENNSSSKNSDIEEIGDLNDLMNM